MTADQFTADSAREGAVGTFLDTVLYPRLTDEFQRITGEDDQKAGIDVIAQWPGRGRVHIDEKSQSSRTYLNNPTTTFVLEIFGESWLDSKTGELGTSTGWHVDDDKTTDIYAFVWVPDASYFTLESIPQGQVIVYRTPSPDAVDDARRKHADLAEVINSTATAGEYRLLAEPASIETFERYIEPVPDAVMLEEQVDTDRPILTAANIRELRVALVDRSTITSVFADGGLSRSRLLEVGTEVAKTGRTVTIETASLSGRLRAAVERSGKRLRVMRSSRDGENPVNLVVPYDVYHEFGLGTYVLRPDEPPVEQRLF